MERVQKGQTYAFISIPYYKVCVTREEYFPTDDKRHKSGNYFENSIVAGKVFQNIDAKFGAQIQAIKATQPCAETISKIPEKLQKQIEREIKHLSLTL